MKALPGLFSLFLIVILSSLTTSVFALEIQHFFEGKEHADIITEATGFKITP